MESLKLMQHACSLALTASSIRFVERCSISCLSSIRKSKFLIAPFEIGQLLWRRHFASSQKRVGPVVLPHEAARLIVFGVDPWQPDLEGGGLPRPWSAHREARGRSEERRVGKE